MAVNSKENLGRPADSTGETHSRQRVRITTTGDPGSLSTARRAGFIDALATILQVEPQAIQEHGVYAGDLPAQDWVIERGRPPRISLRGLRRERPSGGTGGIVFELSLSPEALERLRALLKKESAQLGLLRVQRVAMARDVGEAEEWALSAGRFVLAPSPPAPPPRIEPQKVHLFGPLVIGLMVGCIAWSFVSLTRVIFPAWNGAYLILGCMLSAVEAGYSHQLLRARRRFFGELVRFRAIELAVLFIVIKAGSYVGEGWSAFVADIRVWPHDPLTIFDLETMMAYLLAVLAWLAASWTAGDLDRLGEPPLRSRSYVSPLDSLTSRFFWGGGLMLVISGMALVGDAISANPSRPVDAVLRLVPGSSASGLAFTTLVYFCLGLVMLGQARVALYRLGWQEQGIPVDRALPGRWTRISLVFVALAASLAFLLPTNYQVIAWLLQVAGSAMTWLMAVIAYLGGVIMFVVIALLGLLTSLLPQGGDSEPQPAAPPEFAPPAAAQPLAGATPDWVLMMRSVLFWGLILAALIYVVRAYLRDHPELLSWVGQVRPLRGVRRLWQSVWGWLVRWRRGVRLRLPRRSIRLPAAIKLPESPLRFLRLGALSSRERVLYYYWSILRRAQRLGLSRRPPETPYEYRVSLSPHIPQAERELGRLTDAFLEARYSGHRLESGEDRRVRADWQSVKTALRTLHKKDVSDQESGADAP